MGNIHFLNESAKAEAGVPNDDLVANIEELLNLAKEGRIQGLINIYTNEQGSPNYHMLGQFNNVMETIGTLEVCKFNLQFNYTLSTAIDEG